MDGQIVFVHGRSQHNKDPEALKAQWVEALQSGLIAAGLAMPLRDESIRFPYYGDTLFGHTEGFSSDQIAEVIVRGEDQGDRLGAKMQLAILDEIRLVAGITDTQVAEVAGDDAIQRGVLSYEWVQGILEAIDRYLPYGSGLSLALFTRDVYHYLRNPGVRDEIENGVRQAMERAIPTVVVGHSLGSVVSYNMLKREGQQNGWVIPLFVTLGSPLGVTAIRKAVAPNRHPVSVSEWFNAFDEQDVVALYPLNEAHFPTTPSIVNSIVDNPTENRHGIVGYLSDPTVAAKIYAALHKPV